MATTPSTPDAAAAASAALDPSSGSGNPTNGPVLNLINKRLRALRKKLNRITQTEQSLLQGKTLNSEQQDLLNSKASVESLFDELEKLKSPLSSALNDEIALALNKTNSDDSKIEKNKNKKKGANYDDDVVEDVLKLVYFGSLFDVMPQGDFTALMLTRTHERGCCLTYDYVTDDGDDDDDDDAAAATATATTDGLLGERDLDLIAGLKGLLVSRPMDSGLSHKDALRRCVEHAKLWIERAEEPVGPNSEITYARLREKLDKIMSSDYYTATPEIKAAVEMAAAAAAGNFGSFQVGGHGGSMMPLSVTLQVDGSTGHYQDMEENLAHYEDYDAVENQSNPSDEIPKDNLEIEKPLAELQIQTDEMKQKADMDVILRDVEPREHYAPRRTYQNQRGGRGSANGRRGYPNGRGGRGGRGSSGPYLNGRNQYYDQSGNYYPRNNYNRGRGGRGAGGNNYYHHGATTVNGGHAAENGVVS